MKVGKERQGIGGGIGKGSNEHDQQLNMTSTFSTLYDLRLIVA